VLLILYVVEILVFQKQVGGTVFVPWPVAVLAATTAVFSLIAYVWAPIRYLYLLAFSSYLMLAFTSGVLVIMTGNISSPFAAIWMLQAVFAGLFGLWGLATIFLATNIALIYDFAIIMPRVSLLQLVIFFLASEVPILISYLIWHEKTDQESSKTKAFDALAQQLSQVASKSEIVINAIADGVIAIDAQGMIQLINPSAQTLLGWDKNDAMGLDYRSVFKLTDLKGKDLADNNSPIEQVLLGNKPLSNNDLALLTKSGKKILISLVVSPVGNTNPASGAIAVFRDFTKEKEQEQAKAEFISTAAHEMRTPVAAIEGYLGLALNPATATIDDKAHTYLLKAHESTQHLGRLFQDLLTVSRAEDGRLGTKPSVIDIVKFLREITEGLTPKSEAKGIFLFFKPGGGSGEEGNKTIPPVFFAYADQDQLRELTNNLIDNAIKYTKQGSVTIDVTGDDKNITISIADTGIGIPPEDLPHLFQKFYRVDNSDTREIGGTGLGLYIVRRLAEINNGRVWAESNVGKGSIFYLAIPRISHENAKSLEAQPEQPQPTVASA
jgi:PAS domain S-box-containing protein